ncbi:class A basic helix-loop-helix protein 15 isoform 1-T2 [Menidia menidia]
MSGSPLPLSPVSRPAGGGGWGVTGAHRMRGWKYFGEGATLVISVDKCLLKRGCSHKGSKKRDEKLQLSMSPCQMIQAEDQRQQVTCFCILDEIANATLTSTRNALDRSRRHKKSSSSSFSRQRYRSPNDNRQQSTFTFLDANVKHFLKKETWTGLLSDLRDFFCLITNNLNMGTQQESTTMDSIYRFIVCVEDCTPAQLLGHAYRSGNWRTLTGHTGCCAGDNKNMPTLKPSASKRPFESIPSSEDVESDRSTSCNLENHHEDNLKEALGKEKNVKMRKSVSFDEDVMVYLFDQESPTVELHSENFTFPPNSSSGDPLMVTSEETGLQWEDDFGALDNTFQFQPGRSSQTPSLPSWGRFGLPKPERCSLSQSCLFLTYVTEADLEL